MTQTGYTNAIVNAMLGWLKGFAAWVLRLFNLAGGISPLKFLGDHWIALVVILLAVGVGVDLMVWLIRWRPHWVWFRRKRIVINDDNFFRHENDLPAVTAKGSGHPRRNWVDHEYVVTGNASRRRRIEKATPENRKPIRQSSAGMQEQQHRDIFRDHRFNVYAKQRFTDRYEAEVFNVESLPRRAQERNRKEKPVRKSSGNPVQRKNENHRQSDRGSV